MLSTSSPVKKKLNTVTKITPMVWPPKSKIPEEVAYPTGNVVWVEKSVIVVKKG